MALIDFVQHSLIGKKPEVNHLREDVDTMIALYVKTTEMGIFMGVASEEARAHMAEAHNALGNLICDCAEHFYGLRASSFTNVRAVIDAINHMDSVLEVQ